MIDKRMMYALGQRVGFKGGGMDAGAGQDFGGFSGGDNSPAAGGATGGTTGGTTGGSGDSNNQNDGTPYGAASKPYDPTTSVDNRLAYNTPTGRFSPMSPSTRTQMGNFRDQMQETLQPGLPMAMKLGLGTIFPGAGQIAEYFYNKSYDPFGYLTTPTTTPPPDDGDGQEGIMAMYNPNMLNVSGEVEEEVSEEEKDFIQRFRVANEFRQDKQGQLDPAILEMISKLYT